MSEALMTSGDGSVSARNVRARVFKIVGFLVLAVALYELPLQYDRSTVTKFTTVLCYALAALGLNLLTGFNGQISVGHGAFFGIGAYSAALLVSQRGWPAWATIVLGAVLAFVVGLIVGLPALRIRGVYLALVTLALATLFPAVIVRYSDVTGGTQGITLEGKQRLNSPQFARDAGITNSQWRYYIALVVAVVAFILVRNVVKSRVGRALIAIRDNETPAEVLGINVGVYKVLTFGISAMLAGVGGALFTFNNDGVAADVVDIQLSIILLVAVVIGGVATFAGPAIGAFLVVFLESFFPENLRGKAAPVVFGILLILLMMAAPGGILGLVKQQWAKLAQRFSRADQPSHVA
ncbi:MAG: branched-chain amino acid ABC transporter permease [Acidimicrobiales bacterium]|nr:branched-chain amino acid ABC transporter permease [Acidimicrobiales bacterium]